VPVQTEHFAFHAFQLGGILQTLTITFNPQAVITWVIIGLIAGTLASAFLGMRRMGLLGHIVIGLVGAFIGGFLLSVIQFQIPPAWQAFLAELMLQTIVAFIGSMVFLLIFRLFFGRRYYYRD
jgi:uncharacterized membrane protein YeaQ/YmgE (transglycosylase-associated protein family)